eukprot:1983250-Pleurochrysis_carterae.AAC.3
MRWKAEALAGLQDEVKPPLHLRYSGYRRLQPRLQQTIAYLSSQMLRAAFSSLASIRPRELDSFLCSARAVVVGRHDACALAVVLRRMAVAVATRDDETELQCAREHAVNGREHAVNGEEHAVNGAGHSEAAARAAGNALRAAEDVPRLAARDVAAALRSVLERAREVATRFECGGPSVGGGELELGDAADTRLLYAEALKVTRTALHVQKYVYNKPLVNVEKEKFILGASPS